ncbi:hypothetical protein FHS80_001682 [Porphyromonas circumdentaria]|nr:hypothetical protein [Porphyromonas circumdentaria]
MDSMGGMGVMILITSASIGWATYQIQRNRTLHDYALRYRISV